MKLSQDASIPMQARISIFWRDVLEADKQTTYTPQHGITAFPTLSSQQTQAQVAASIVINQKQQHNQKEKDASALMSKQGAAHVGTTVVATAALVPAEVLENFLKSQKAISTSSEHMRERQREMGSPGKMSTIPSIPSMGLNRPAHDMLYLKE